MNVSSVKENFDNVGELFKSTNKVFDITAVIDTRTTNETSHY